MFRPENHANEWKVGDVVDITNPTLHSKRKYISFGYGTVVDPTEILFPKIYIKIDIQDNYQMHLISSLLPCNTLMWRADSLEKTDAGKDWRQEEKWVTEDEMVGWHHRLDGHEFELAPGDGEGQGSLACCSPWGQKESDMTEQLKNSIPCDYLTEQCCLCKSYQKSF